MKKERLSLKTLNPLSKFESYALTTQPRMLRVPKKLATNNEATYAKKNSNPMQQK